MPKPRVSPLPIKNGIAPSYLHLNGGQGLLVDFLTIHFPHVAREVWCERMRAGEVLKHDGTVLTEKSLFPAYSTIYYYRGLSNEESIPFKERVLFQDEHLVVVDKPHFLPVTPSGRFLQETLLTRLRKSLGIEQLSPLHRLDKDTAGIVLFSCQPSSRGIYQNLFRTQKIHKIYHAIASTRTDLDYPLIRESFLVEHKQQFFRMVENEGQPNSRSSIVLLENRGANSLYKLKPYTGKKHQLRVHMLALGIPILNDSLYPFALPIDVIDYSKPLQLLAKSIQFIDPISQQERYFQSTLWL